MARGERRDRLRQEHTVGARERGTAQDAGDMGRRALERGLGGLELAQDALGAGHELLARRGQPAAAAVALEQRDAGLALERRELLGDRRGGVAEGVGGGGDRPAGGELAQDAEATDVKHAKAQLMPEPRNRNWRFRSPVARMSVRCALPTSPSPSSSPRSGA
jgi:hypothetical protein